MSHISIFKISCYCFAILHIAGTNCFLLGVDYDGNDIHGNVARTDSATDCQALCKNVANCEQFSWVGSDLTYNSGLKGKERQCRLKDKVGKGSIVDGVISGPKECGR